MGVLAAYKRKNHVVVDREVRVDREGQTDNRGREDHGEDLVEIHWGHWEGHRGVRRNQPGGIGGSLGGPSGGPFGSRGGPPGAWR